MPSNRRLRVLLYVAFALFFVVIYFTSDARQARSREFYEKTVEKINEKAQAQDTENADMGRKMSERLQEAENVAKGNADQKLPYQKPVGVAKTPSEEKAKETDAASGRKPVGVDNKKPWVTMEESAEEKKDEPTQEEREVEAELGSILKRSPIIIFSKSYCPFSQKAKDVLVSKYKIVPSPFVVELNEHPLGTQLQSALEKTTGRRTVPNVLVSGKSIGGGDDIVELDEKGELIELIRKMAGKRIMEANVREIS
ncbi:MAG: hypothetical protein M4579_006493 [Chaenotheca gracillima]|nr:MAG: hypothetical protein M4579_006493 [Chaenotheca gracillima]